MSIFNSFLYVSPRRCISSPRAPGTAMKNRIIPGPGNGQAMLLQARLVPPHLAILRCAMQGAIERKTQKNTEKHRLQYLHVSPVFSSKISKIPHFEWVNHREHHQVHHFEWVKQMVCPAW